MQLVYIVVLNGSVTKQYNGSISVILE